MNNVKGVIMAGGLGTRFRPLTNYFQKCMIPIGAQEKPILEYIVRLYNYHDIKELILLAGYKHQQIENFFNHGERFGVKMNYVLDEPGVKGSASAVLNAYQKKIFNVDDTLVIYYGDIVSNINLREMVKHHNKMDAKATIALAPNFTVNVGVAEIKDNWIKKFIEKPNLPSAVSIGILILDGSVLEVMDRIYMKEKYESFDLMGHVVQNLVDAGDKVSPYITDAFWYDVGSIERYERLSNDKIDEELGFLLR
jgi:mannose-1-phosphate guanylyltransferase